LWRIEEKGEISRQKLIIHKSDGEIMIGFMQNKPLLY
jgi:hypothetical protein